MKKAILVVGFTVDFVADNGALSCQIPVQLIEKAVVSITQDFGITMN